LKATPDVVGSFAAKYTKPVYVAFAAGGADVIKDAEEKLERKHVDAILPTVLTLPRRDLL